MTEPRTTHIVGYFAKGSVMGVALVKSAHTRPSWSECAAQIPGFVSARHLGNGTEK
jgi:hypothetical protein